MSVVANIAIAVAFAAFAALVFAGLTLLLGLLVREFEICAQEGWSFLEFYLRYLYIAAVYTSVALLSDAVSAITCMAGAYKFVFKAGWPQALVMGTAGGLIATALFRQLFNVALTPAAWF